jgi:hypothetical protein
MKRLAEIREFPFLRRGEFPLRTMNLPSTLCRKHIADRAAMSTLGMAEMVFFSGQLRRAGPAPAWPRGFARRRQIPAGPS